MSGFNAARSRAKRPCPLWVDAFQRDTQHLEADEVGAYFLILMAMWTRESCDFPDDDTRLARVSRVSVRLWKSRIGPVLREFFKTENGSLISKRLREEAAYTERQVKHQSDRKRGENSDKSLESNEPDETTDISVGISTAPSYPTTQLPTEDTNANALDGEAVDFHAEAVWKNGVPYLVSRHVPERQARTVIGKWLKSGSASDVYNAMAESKKSGTEDPIPYITEILKPKGSSLDDLFRKAREVKQ